MASGAVTIGGVDVRDMDLAELCENVGIVQQNVYLFYGTVKENILYGRRDATDEEVIAAAKLAGAHDFIMKLDDGYDTKTRFAASAESSSAAVRSSAFPLRGCSSKIRPC